jgi:uncharacterized protein (TIGR00251 family)
MDGHLKVRVQPRAGRDDVEVVEGERLRVRVTVPAEGGKANEALVALLASRLRVSKGSVTIVRGHRSRDKLVDVNGLTADEVLSRLSRPGG